jgi:hypothetical protein
VSNGGRKLSLDNSLGFGLGGIDAFSQLSCPLFLLGFESETKNQLDRRKNSLARNMQSKSKNGI